MQTRVHRVVVHTKRAFAIARSSDDTFERVVFEVEEDGFVGRGEAPAVPALAFPLFSSSTPGQ